MESMMNATPSINITLSYTIAYPNAQKPLELPSNLQRQPLEGAIAKLHHRCRPFQIIPAETPFINTIWVIKEASEIILKTMMFFPVVVFGIFGNILVVFVLASNAHIRTPTNLLVGNMAAADLLSLLIHPWVTLVYDIFQNYQLGAVGCKGEATVECSVMIASVMSMSAITYDRLTAIVLPQETRLNKRGAKIVMVITWVFGFLLSIPIFLYRNYRERQWLNFLEKYCTENLLIINIYWYFLITVLVWLPLTIQIICYISIFVKLNKYEKMIVKKFQNQQISYKKKAARMMFVVTLTFMTCRVPFTALIIYRHQMIKMQKIGISYDVTNQANGTYHSLWFTSKYLIFINAAINPLIYGVTNEKFLRAFKSTGLSKWLFPSTKKEVIISKPIGQQKIGQDTTSKNTIFLIFKRKHKVADGPVPVTKKTNVNTNL